MVADAAFWHCLLTGLAGFALSLLAEFFVLPRPGWKRPWQAWCMAYALWAFPFSCLVCLTGRPFCAAGFTLAFIAILVFVNNAKFRSMREPFIFQDYDYFLATIRFPRLFLPFLGLTSFSLCAIGVVLSILALWLEAPPSNRWSIESQAGASLFFLLTGCASFFLAKRYNPIARLSPETDIVKLGFLASIGFYGLKCAQAPSLPLSLHGWPPVLPDNYPHLLAIQSESFFDARECWQEIRPEIYKNIDLFISESFLHGQLLVPAWGANTERSEFSFLTGLSPSVLGINRFNPYRAMLHGHAVPSLASHLRSLGYKTICVHPYLSAFYDRNKVFPKLGFDLFVEINSFSRADHYGPYIADLALANKILEIQRASSVPTFIFAITMENHGPLHLEKIPDESAQKKLFKKLPPAGCAELGIYLRHSRNTGRMLEKLHSEWTRQGIDASICFYGDHVPIMPETWKNLGSPPGHVPFFCWSNRIPGDANPCLLACHQLAAAWLHGLNHCVKK